MKETDYIKMVVPHDRQERQPITAVWRNGGLIASYDSFAGKETVVLRINICSKIPPLRQAANRYGQLYETTTKRTGTTRRLTLKAQLTSQWTTLKTIAQRQFSNFKIK